jgi:Ca-activated chloride channel family protein
MRLVFGMALVLGLLAAGPVAADLPPVGGGTLFVKTGADGPLQPAPVLQTDVRIRVTGMIARVEVAQRFHNPTAAWLEGIYVFPLPEGAAVDTLFLRVGERVLEGQIREREEAKQTYVQARQEGRKATLLEQERPNIFTVSVANIGPGDEVSVVFHYQELIRYDSGEFRLRFPTVAGPRYNPGTAEIPGFAGTGWGVNTPEVPDAARITPTVLHPSRGPINPVGLVVELAAGFPLRRVESPFHAVAVTAMGDGSHVLALREGTAPADRDFELVWAPRPGAAPQAAAWSETHEGEHYALVMLLPPAAEATGVSLPREVIYVVDTSGSMAGASIQQARLALDEALAALDAHDRFNVIEFNSTATRLFPRPVAAGHAEVEHARRWVAGLQANGGTEMLKALELALDGDAGQQVVRQVVFVTDGQVGNEDQLFRFIHERLGESRLFTVGIGASPNGHFMTKAAQFGRGTYTYIGSPTEVAEKMGALFRKLERPVLADVAVDWSGRADVEAWPARVPDLYAGEPLVLVARLGPDPRATLRVAGRRDGQGWNADLPLDAGLAETGIHRLWARKKIGGLMDRLREGGDRDEVRSAVVAVALRHRLVSAYTSLVAVDVTPTRPAHDGLETGLVPANLPAGAEYEKIFGKLPQTATPMELYLVLGLACLAVALATRRWAFR